MTASFASMKNSTPHVNTSATCGSTHTPPKQQTCACTRVANRRSVGTRADKTQIGCEGSAQEHERSQTSNTTTSCRSATVAAHAAPSVRQASSAWDAWTTTTWHNATRVNTSCLKTRRKRAVGVTQGSQNARNYKAGWPRDLSQITTLEASTMMENTDTLETETPQI
jgi:hypothetical protein